MSTTFHFPFCLLALVLSGCVFPTHLADEAPFGDEVTGLVEPGSTTKSDVRAQLGDRYSESSNGRWWVFSADRRMTEWFAFMCGPYGPCSGAEFGGDVHQYNLIIDFGSDDIVRNLAVVTDQSPCTDDQSICLDDLELSVIEDGNALKYILEDNASKMPCAFLRISKSHESDDSPTQFLDLRDAECLPALVMRDGLVYALEATEPYTGQLTISGVAGVGKFERSYENGRLNGAETIWSESGEKIYQAYYRNNLLHGPVTYGTLDGTTGVLLCYENGDVAHLNADDCDP